MSFEKFVGEIEENKWNVFGVEYYEDGKLVNSYGDTNQNRYPIYSATKTITSLAAGMAVEEGKLDLDVSILNYLPGKILNELSQKQRETFRLVTTKRLLTMSIKGFPFRPEGESFLKYSLNIPLPDVTKKEFDYSNISAYLVDVVTACAIEEDLYQYLQRKLFTPLHIENPPYTCCPDGYFYGASKMELTVNELSRIGLLLYHNGVYEGNRIVSESYVAKATSVQQMNREGGYGFFIWKYRNGFSINGKWKQKCYILPEEKKIITYLAHIEDDSNDLRTSMEKNLL